MHNSFARQTLFEFDSKKVEFYPSSYLKYLTVQHSGGEGRWCLPFCQLPTHWWKDIWTWWTEGLSLEDISEHYAENTNHSFKWCQSSFFFLFTMLTTQAGPIDHGPAGQDWTDAVRLWYASSKKQNQNIILTDVDQKYTYICFPRIFYISNFRPIIEARMAKYTAGEIHFNLMALIQDRTVRYIRTNLVFHT